MDGNDETILTNAWQPDHWSIPHVLFFLVFALLGATWRDVLLVSYAWKAVEATPWVDVAVAPDALIVDPLEALYGWIAVWFLRRYGSPGYAVCPLEDRGWAWWRVALVAYAPLLAQTIGAATQAYEDKPRPVLGVDEHYVWGASFGWALATTMVCAPRQWPGRFAWSVWGWFIFYYTAQLIAFHYNYNGWFLATWVHLGLVALISMLFIFTSRPRPPGYLTAA